MTSTKEKVINYVILTVFALLVIFPIINFALAAISPDSSGRVDMSSFSWSNFADAWTRADFSHAMLASAVVTIGSVLGQVILAILCGYGFGVLGVFGQKYIFPIILLGMMISTEAIVIPLYYTFRDMGLTNSWLGLIIIQIGMGVPFGTFWMRSAFRALPGSLIEAARLDGAGSIRILFKVLLPIVKPAVYTLLLLTFMWTWNDYFLSLIFISDPSKQTATVALGAFQGKYLVEVNLMAAAGIIVAAPILILYVLFQRKFISGIMSGAIKE